MSLYSLLVVNIIIFCSEAEQEKTSIYMPEAGVLPGTVATAGAGAEAGDKSIPSVHAVWQMWQDGKISKDQFVEALGGDLPDPVVRVLNQVDCTYSQFVKSYGTLFIIPRIFIGDVGALPAPTNANGIYLMYDYDATTARLRPPGQQNSFASKSAGNRTQYRDNVRSLINDNSAPMPSTTFEHAATNYKRVRSDISRQAEKEPNFRVRKANDVSRNNPLSSEATAVTENAGSGTAAAEEEANLHLSLIHI